MTSIGRKTRRVDGDVHKMDDLQITYFRRFFLMGRNPMLPTKEPSADMQERVHVIVSLIVSNQHIH